VEVFSIIFIILPLWAAPLSSFTSQTRWHKPMEEIADIFGDEDLVVVINMPISWGSGEVSLLS